jgi:predicted MFS family arabinose efflux permease
VIAIFLTQKSGGKLLKMGLIFEMILFGFFSIIVFPYFVQLFGGASWLYLGIIAVIFIIIGFSNSFVNTPLNVFFQKAAPTEIRSRVLSVIAVLSQLIVPLGTAIYGFLLDRFSPHFLILVSFLIGMVVIVVFLVKGPFKTMDEKINMKVNPENLQETEAET